MLKLSVNILTWNCYEVLHKTMHILAEELRGIDSEVIIVDNGSNDGCQDLATIKNPINLGISVGKNQGIDSSNGEYILLLDGDVMPVPNSIRCLLEYMENNKYIDALGFHPNKWSNQFNNNGQKHHEDYCDKLVNLTEHGAHACYYGMYRRTVFERGVRFDEALGAGYGWEDCDMYMTMEKLGIKQYFIHINHPAGKYYHAINSSIRNMGFEKYMETCKDRERYFKKKWENNKCLIP